MGGLFSSYSQQHEQLLRQLEDVRRRKLEDERSRIKLEYERRRKLEDDRSRRKLEYERRRKLEDEFRNQENLFSSFQNLSLRETTANVHKIIPNRKIIDNFLAILNQPPNNLIQTVQPSAVEYSMVNNCFTKTNKKCYTITNIEKVLNPYLLVQFHLKKYYLNKYGAVETKYLFHGTRMMNVDQICKSNFDWRLAGRSKGHKFGRGVSFTSISNYATHYSDKSRYDKIMILSNVLVENDCIGTSETIIPPLGYDTTTNNNKQVYVKYDDNTFYPEFVIYYEGHDNNKYNKHPSIY